jgi:hypothetical protein
MEFETRVLEPFLARNPAVSAWLDPTFLLIAQAGPPPAQVAEGIAQINVGGPGENYIISFSISTRCAVQFNASMRTWLIFLQV